MAAKKHERSDLVDIIVEAVAAALERGEEIKTLNDYPLQERIEKGWQCPECMQHEIETYGHVQNQGGFRCCVCGHKWGRNTVRPRY